MEKLTDKQESILKEIKIFIAKNGYSPSIRELCDICGLQSSATMFVHLKNLTKKGYINQANKKFRTIELRVLNEYDKRFSDIIKVPLLGKVDGESAIEAIENPNETLTLSKILVPKNEDVFALLVKDDSMINAGISSNDVVIIARSNSANNGEMIAVLNDEGEVILRTYYEEEEHIRLQPENDKMDSIIVPKCKILGKVSGIFKIF